VPLIAEALVPSRGLFLGLLTGQVALAVCVILGRAARPALLASSVVGVYGLLCDRLSYHNNRYALFLFCFLLAFAPCDRAFVLGRRWEPLARRAPLWAQRLAAAQLSLIYAVSGTSKLLDADWRQGRVLGDRLYRYSHMALEAGVPVAVLDVLSEPQIMGALAKLAICTEIFLAFGLWWGRTRPFALWWGVMFHLTIELTSRVEIFGWLCLTIYALFAAPALRERSILFDPKARWAAWLAAVVRRLDWLARFDISARDGGSSGHALMVVERDLSSASGVLALARTARATPLLFPLSFPLFALAALSRSRPYPSPSRSQEGGTVRHTRGSARLR
jgi:hypothetical protein